jgi:hypothetical protein
MPRTLLVGAVGINLLLAALASCTSCGATALTCWPALWPRWPGSWLTCVIWHIVSWHMFDDALLLDHARRIAALHDVPYGHPNISLAIRASLRLRWLAPAALEQQRDGGHASSVTRAILGNAGQDFDTHRGMGPGQRSQIRRQFSHLAWGCPPSLLHQLAELYHDCDGWQRHGFGDGRGICVQTCGSMHGPRSYVAPA